MPNRPGSSTAGGVAGTYYGGDREPHYLQQLSAKLPTADRLLLACYSPAVLNEPSSQQDTYWRLARQPDGRLVGTVGGYAAQLRPVRPRLSFTVQLFSDSVAAFPGQAHSPYG